MTDLRTAAQQALEAMRRAVPTGEITLTDWMKANHDLETALAEPNRAQKLTEAGYTRRPTLREMAAEPVLNPAPGYCKHCKQYTIEEPLPAEPVEPVAWMTVRLNVPIQTTARKDVADEWLKWGEVQPLYTAPPQRPVEPVQDHFPDATKMVHEPVQEPVAKCIDDICSEHLGRVEAFDHLPRGTPLYAAPPQRKPLTEEEIWALYYALPSDDFERSDRIDFARAVEAAHGIKEGT